MREKNNRSIINIGTSLMVVILIGLAFAVIAALAISSSQNNYNMASKLANHTTEYYAASNLAYEKLASNGWVDQEFTVQIDDNQELVVSVENGEITRWQVISSSDWEAESSQPVITIEE